MSLLKSSSLFTLLEFIEDLERLRLQLLSKHFYNKVIPQSIYNFPLSYLTRNQFFSYSVDRGSMLFKYSIKDSKWDGFYASNHGKFKLNFSSDVVITDQNKIYFIGGSANNNLNKITKEVLEWNLLDNRVSYKSKMPLKMLDFGSVYLKGYIYCAGGWSNLNHLRYQIKTARLNINTDSWELLQDIPQALGKCSLCVVDSTWIYAFFEETSRYYRLNTKINENDEHFGKWNEMRVNTSVFFGFAMGCYCYENEKILLIGGDQNEDNLQEQKLKQQENLIIKIFDTRQNKIERFKVLTPQNDINNISLMSSNDYLSLKKEDFFYFNQIVFYNSQFYALGKDHIHVISKDFKEVRCLEGEGDYYEDFH